MSDWTSIAKAAVTKTMGSLSNILELSILETKKDMDLVTEADIKAQDSFLNVIKNSGKSCIIYSEELKKPLKIGKIPSSKIYIDPVDGSYEMLKGAIRFVCIAILVCDIDDNPICAAVGDLSNRDIYTADDSGAYLNGKKIRPSKTRDLNGALIGVYAEKSERFKKLPMFNPLIDKGARILNFSNHVIMSQVGAGIFDAGIELLPIPLYEFAGPYIARQAGATVTTLEGKELQFKNINQTCLTATTPELHRKILELIS